MKILKYALKPMKYIVLLLSFAALGYYRLVIFHPDLNKHADAFLSYVETEFNLKILAYIPEMDLVETQSVVISDKKPDDVEVTLKESKLDVVEDVVSVQVGHAAGDVPSENKMTAIVDNGLTEKELNLIDELSDTVNLINEKIDRLYEQGNTVTTEKNRKIEEPVLEIKSVTDTPGDSVVEEQASKPAAMSVISDVDNILLMARQSFWNGNSRLSEKFYMDLTHYGSSNPDIYGELGNVYYAQGKWKKAGEAYYEAAIRLIELKQNAQVSYLLRVIQGLDAVSADKLRHKISG